MYACRPPLICKVDQLPAAADLVQNYRYISSEKIQNFTFNVSAYTGHLEQACDTLCFFSHTCRFDCLAYTSHTFFEMQTEKWTIPLLCDM